jgi:hypothetical protein
MRKTKKVNKFFKKTKKTKKTKGGYFGETVKKACKNNELSKASIAGINIYIQEKIALLGFTKYKQTFDDLSMKIYSSFVDYIRTLITTIKTEFGDDYPNLNDYQALFALPEDKSTFSFVQIYDKMYLYARHNVFLAIMIYNEIEPESKIKDIIKTPFYNNELLQQRRNNDAVNTTLRDSFSKIKEDYLKQGRKEWLRFMLNLKPTSEQYKLYRTVWNIYTTFDYDFPFLKQKRCVSDKLCFSNLKSTALIDYEHKYLLNHKDLFTNDELEALRALKYNPDNEIDIDASEINKNLAGFKYVGSDLIKKDIGSTITFLPKNTEYYKHFYENGFIVKSGLSGTLPYFDTLYLSMKQYLTTNGVSDYTFFFLYALYMLYRTDHSLIELLVSYPLNDVSKQFKTTYNIKSYDELSQDNVWGLINHIVTSVNSNIKQLTYNIDDIEQLLNERTEYISTIC